eukprot:4181798-Pyramimonas_sp.AAC.2
MECGSPVFEPLPVSRMRKAPTTKQTMNLSDILAQWQQREAERAHESMDTLVIYDATYELWPSAG